MNETQFAITVFVFLLLISSVVAMVTKWVQLPYTVALVIIGLAVSPMHFLPPVHISPELILLIFLPTLLFEAAWNLKLDDLRRNLLPILTLATIGVTLSVGIIGLILHYTINLSWPSALLFGSIISATDPVSVLALFKKLGAPHRLTTIVEGESLFNDGTAIVVFRILLGIVIGATTLDSTSNLIAGSLREFVVVVCGGLIIGAGVGFAASTVTSYFDDHLLEITLTTIAAYGSFLGAESLHVSPVISVLASGIIIGNYGWRVGMSPNTRISVDSFWEYAAFVVNSLVFLLIGLEFGSSMEVGHLVSIMWAVLAMLIARVIAIYGLVPLTNLFIAPLTFRWQHILFWGGLRGSLSIALVLSLPLGLPDRPQLVAMTFGAVMFSLLAQGLTISPLLNWLGLSQRKPGYDQFELLRGKLLAERAASNELEILREQGIVTEAVYQAHKSNIAQSEQELSRDISELEVKEGAAEEEGLRIEQYLSNVRKRRLTELLQEGLITEESFNHLKNQTEENQ